MSPLAACHSIVKVRLRCRTSPENVRHTRVGGEALVDTAAGCLHDMRMGERRRPWVGVSRQHAELLALIDRVARNNVELLFSGETGVGKEQYARYAHERSSRRDKPFV